MYRAIINVCKYPWGGGGNTYPINENGINDYAMKNYVENLHIRKDTFRLCYELRKIKTGYRKSKKYLNILNGLKYANTPKKFWDTYGFYNYYTLMPSDIHHICSIRDTITYCLGCVLNEHKQSWYKGDFYYALRVAQAELDRFKRAIYLQSIIYDHMPSYPKELFHSAVNFIDSSNEILDYIQGKMDIIIDWITSLQFYEEYILTKYPYPPLLNPRDVDYDSLYSHIAFVLNIPLPDNYDFVVCLKGLSGHYAFSNFLSKCITLIAHDRVRNRVPLRSIDIYSQWYDGLKANADKKCALSRHYDVTINTDMMIDNIKLLYLSCSKKDVIYLVRDPISKLKSAINHTNTHIESIDIFNMTFNPDILVSHWCYYLTGDYPDMGFMIDKGAALHADWIGFAPHFNPICGEAIYIDTSDITRERTLDTMRFLGNRFGFCIPNDDKFFLAKSGGVMGYMIMSGKKMLYIHQDDIDKQSCDRESLCKEGGYRIYFKLIVDSSIDQALIVVNDLFFSSDEWFDNIELLMYRDESLALQSNVRLFNKAKQYLQSLLIALRKRIAIEEAKMVDEDDILQFIKRSGKLEYAKDLLSKQVSHIQCMRPDIVESWEYYQKLMRMK